jgi:hypothetical protein
MNGQSSFLALQSTLTQFSGKIADHIRKCEERSRQLEGTEQAFTDGKKGPVSHCGR